MKNLYLVAACLFLFGCSGDPYEKYLGLWNRSDVRNPQVLQILKDGDTYLLNENIFQKNDLMGRPRNNSVLVKSEGQLSAVGFGGSAALGLSADENTLHFANRKYTRISDSEVEAIKNKL